MAAVTGRLRLAPEWDARFTRSVGLSAVAHVVALVLLLVLMGRARTRPLPLVAYTVELTSPGALGGRLPPGAPGRDLAGGPESPPPPAPSEPKPEVAAKPEPKPEPKPAPEPAPPEVRIPDKVKPPVPKPEPAKAEPPKPAPAAAPPAAAPPTSAARAPAPPAAAGPASEAPRDAYGAAAERWRARSGGGVGGTEGGSGPIGTGGEGPGGGGQLVGLEFLTYHQHVVNAVKARWANVVRRPGLVAEVAFDIAPDGAVSNVRVQQSSGDPAYDGSALRAVQHASPLEPPPVRYRKEFREFHMRFHSEERGGEDVG